MAKIKRTAAEIAAELLVVRHQKNELLQLDKELSTELRKRIKRGEAQDTYQIRVDYALDVTDNNLAFEFAHANNLMKVDIPAVDQWVKNNRHSIPQGFSLVEKEKLVEVKE